MKSITIGMDLGDKNHVVCVLDETGKTISNATIENNQESLTTFFLKYKGATVAMEAGTHSPWISRQLSVLGCTVLVGNPRKLRVIWDSNDKSDERDAKMLAQIARFDSELLYPITHRGQQAQLDLEIKSHVLILNCCTLLHTVVNKRNLIWKFFRHGIFW